MATDLATSSRSPLPAILQENKELYNAHRLDLQATKESCLMVSAGSHCHYGQGQLDAAASIVERKVELHETAAIHSAAVPGPSGPGTLCGMA